MKTLVAAMLVVVVGFGAHGSTPTVEAQIDIPGCKGSLRECGETWLTTTREGIGCDYQYGAVACLHAWDAKEWVQSLVPVMFPGSEGDGEMGNAFGHCAWMGALATRVGFDTAVGIGDNHEDVNPNGPGLYRMDVANNEIGARIGDDAAVASSDDTWEYADDTWGYVMDTCESLAQNGALYGICGVQGAYLPSDYRGDPNDITCSGGGGW